MKMDGDSFYLARRMAPLVAWTARGIMAGQFSLAACRRSLAATAEKTAARAGFERRASDIINLDDLLSEAVGKIQADIDRVLEAIQADVRPMVRARAPLNAIQAQAHERNGAAGFPIHEQDLTEVVRGMVRAMVAPVPPERGCRYAR